MTNMSQYSGGIIPPYWSIENKTKWWKHVLQKLKVSKSSKTSI